MAHADGDKYDGLYHSWLQRQGQRAIDAKWRESHLLRRHRAERFRGAAVRPVFTVDRYFWDPDHGHFYDEAALHRVLAPWGKVRLRRYYRTPFRNLVPFRQRVAAVFIFQVTPARVTST